MHGIVAGFFLGVSCDSTAWLWPDSQVDCPDCKTTSHHVSPHFACGVG